MKFLLGGHVINFERGASYPASRPYEIMQTFDRVASGTFMVEDLGIDIETRQLNFVAMTKTDHDALHDWYVSVSVGAKNSFEFTDEVGRVGTVRIVSPSFIFREIAFELYEGQLILEYV